MGTYGQPLGRVLSTGANCLLEVSEQGKTAQMVDLGTSILPPNAITCS